MFYILEVILGLFLVVYCTHNFARTCYWQTCHLGRGQSGQRAEFQCDPLTPGSFSFPGVETVKRMRLMSGCFSFVHFCTSTSSFESQRFEGKTGKPAVMSSSAAEL